ncbi:hypothetical protein ABZT06_08160 [Streptomyces sp. NPDC005483]|uniref:hypothetical protein n=1 Tax=Streptomyces sp. NPDC005483 TaxID=3154882 RepID=UPI0033AA5326
MPTGPQRYPGASTTAWHQAKWGGDLMEVNVCVLHTTEGVGLPSYDGGSMAPNLTAVADFAAQRLKWYQHFDIDRSSRALQNLAGGVQTNTLNVTQVELDGTCDYSKRQTWGSRVAGKDYIYWGNPPDWALRDLAGFLRWLNANHKVPLTGPAMWLTYGPDARRPGITPASYGASPARMPFAQWNAFNGICGHEHVPENDHGDPGSLPFTKLIALAKGTTVPQEDDVALTDADIDKIATAAAKKTLTLDGVIKSDTDSPDNPFVSLATVTRNAAVVVRRVEKKVDVLPAVELTDVQIATLASAVAANPALAEQIAEKVAVKLAERLAN